MTRTVVYNPPLSREEWEEYKRKPIFFCSDHLNNGGSGAKRRMIELDDLDNDEVYIEYSGQWWSTSALKTMQTCGKQYWFRYIQKEKTKPTVYLAFGRAVHKVIELAHRNNNFTDRYWMDEWNKIWNDLAAQVDWKGFKKTTFTSSGLKILGNYMDNNSGAKVLASELKFPGKDEGYSVGPYKVRGVIDQIRRLPDGKLAVYDFKTSSKIPDPLVLRNDPQWTLYWDYARKRLGEEPVLAWYHLKTGETIYTERTEKDLDVVIESLNDVQARVDQKQFSKSIGFNCYFCDFRQKCLSQEINE